MAILIISPVANLLGQTLVQKSQLCQYQHREIIRIFLLHFIKNATFFSLFYKKCFAFMCFQGHMECVANVNPSRSTTVYLRKNPRRNVKFGH